MWVNWYLKICVFWVEQQTKRLQQCVVWWHEMWAMCGVCIPVGASGSFNFFDAWSCWQAAGWRLQEKMELKEASPWALHGGTTQATIKHIISRRPRIQHVCIPSLSHIGIASLWGRRCTPLVHWAHPDVPLWPMHKALHALHTNTCWFRHLFKSSDTESVDFKLLLP